MSEEAPLYIIEHEGLETRLPGIELVCLPVAGVSVHRKRSKSSRTRPARVLFTRPAKDKLKLTDRVLGDFSATRATRLTSLSRSACKQRVRRRPPPRSEFEPRYTYLR